MLRGEKKIYSKTFIRYKGYFSSPFARWQGSLQNERPVELAGATAKKWLAQKKFDPKMFEYLFLGVTIAHHRMFYAAPWAAALIGADHINYFLRYALCSLRYASFQELT